MMAKLMSGYSAAASVIESANRKPTPNTMSLLSAERRSSSARLEPSELGETSEMTAPNSFWARSRPA